MTDEFILKTPPRVDNIDFVNKMLEHMADINGSDLFIMGSSEVFCSRYGRKVRITDRKLTEGEAKNVISAIYNSNAMSFLGAGQPIDCSHEFYVEKKMGGDEMSFSRKRYRFRVNAVNCLREGRISLTTTIRSIPTDPPRWDVLGVEKDIIDVSRNLDQGLVLVVGATGNGKSTLLAAILRDRIEDPEGNVNLVTIEKPIEFVYDSIPKPSSFITQLQVGQHIHSFHEGVVNALRMAPNIILVGETRDLETTQASLEASMTGHGVYSTVHANNVVETFQRLVYVFPQELQTQAKVDILQPMRMIVAQRLVPTVDGKRTAIREYMVFDQQHKDRMLASKNFIAESFKLVSDHGRPMIVDAQEKYADGIISEATFKRIQANYAALKESMR